MENKTENSRCGCSMAPDHEDDELRQIYRARPELIVNERTIELIRRWTDDFNEAFPDSNVSPDVMIQRFLENVTGTSHRHDSSKESPDEFIPMPQLSPQRSLSQSTHNPVHDGCPQMPQLSPQIITPDQFSPESTIKDQNSEGHILSTQNLSCENLASNPNLTEGENLLLSHLYVGYEIPTCIGREQVSPRSDTGGQVSPQPECSHWISLDCPTRYRQQSRHLSSQPRVSSASNSDIHDSEVPELLVNNPWMVSNAGMDMMNSAHSSNSCETIQSLSNTGFIGNQAHPTGSNISILTISSESTVSRSVSNASVHHDDDDDDIFFMGNDYDAGRDFTVYIDPWMHVPDRARGDVEVDEMMRYEYMTMPLLLREARAETRHVTRVPMVKSDMDLNRKRKRENSEDARAAKRSKSEGNTSSESRVKRKRINTKRRR